MHSSYLPKGRFLRRNIFEKYLSKIFADKYFSAARFEKYGKRLRNFYFWFSWRDLKAFRSGVTGGRKKGTTFHWSVVSVHFEYCTMFVVVSRTFSVLCPRNWRDLYGNTIKFSQADQRTVSYVPDPFVVTKRHKGQQATSWLSLIHI